MVYQVDIVYDPDLGAIAVLRDEDGNMVATGADHHVPERVYARGEAWVECSCGEAVTCGLGAEFGFDGHSHSDDCLPLVCPGSR